MASYASRLRQDISRWLDMGLIDRPIADALGRDVEANERGSLSFGSILAIMAALLFGAALLLLIAANWEAFPRLLRVAVLFAIILGCHVGGAILKLRDHDAIAEAAWLIAAAAFGGSIALIGQMYHLSGDEADAVLTWCFGTALAAAALRSGPLTVAAVGLAVAWLFMEGVWDQSRVPGFFILVAAGLWLVSWWTESRASRHLLLLSVIFHVALLAIHHDFFGIALMLTAASAALFALAVFLPVPVERLVQLDGHLPFHALAGFLVGITMVQVEPVDESAPLVVAALAAFAGIAAAVVLAGREKPGPALAGLCRLQLPVVFRLCGHHGHHARNRRPVPRVRRGFGRRRSCHHPGGKADEGCIPAAGRRRVMGRNRLIISAVVLAFVQIGFLSWIIAGRAAILRDGRDVLLKVEPVDPRDLLRGDYVRLGYDITSIPVKMIGNIPAGMERSEAGPIFVRVAKGADGFWRAISASLGEPSSAPPGEDEIDIRGVVPDGWSLGEIDTLTIEYGIERFYLPEGEGLAIEHDMRMRSFSIVAAICPNGSPQIKALMDGDTMLFQEPLY